MTEALYQFEFSEDKARKNSRDIFFVLVPILLIWAGVFALYITDFQVKKALSIFCYPSLFLLVIFAIEAPLIRWRLRKIKAFVYDDRIIKRCGKHENSIPWGSIIRVKIIEDNKGETIHIQLKGKDKAVLWLGGLNEMDKLAGMIRQRIQSDISVNTKRYKLSMRLMFLISIIFMMIVMMPIASFGKKAMDIFTISAALGISSFLFLYRPIGKFDASLKWPEIVLYLMLFMVGIYGLVSFLRGGFLP